MTSLDNAQSLTPEQERLMRLRGIFMPYASKKSLELYQASGFYARFVHYTSAEAALKIIKSKRIWMRNTTCMSDYSEVTHGFNILWKFFSDQNNKKEFIEVLERCASGVAEEALKLFDQLWNDIQFNTYISAVSEHDEKEDLHGRLSMWRAFGGNIARVAIVINVPWKSESAEEMNLKFSPVAYLKEEDAYNELNTVIKNVRTHSDFLCSMDRQLVVNMVFHMLMMAVVCLKHEGFHEEREWRVIYAPKRLPSILMESSTEIIGGIPQFVYKIPIDNKVPGIPGDIDLTRLFDRLIIGPSHYPWAMYESFVTALTEAGITDAGGRVFTSGIPIRI